MLILQGRKLDFDRLALSPDGLRLAVSNVRGYVQVWDLEGRKIAFRLPPGPGTYGRNSVSFSPHGDLFLLRGHLLRLIDGRGTQTDLLSRQGPWQQPLSHVALSPRRGHLFLSAFNTYRLTRCRLPDLAVDWDRQGDDALWVTGSLTCSLDGNTLAGGTFSGGVVILDANTGDVRQRVGPGTATYPTVRSVALSPDGRTVAWCAATHLRVWGLSPAGEIAHHRLGKTHFHSVSFHPSGRFFASANGDGKIDYWDARTGEHREAFDWGVGKLNDVAFDASGDRAACCGKSGQIVVWDVDR